MEDVTWEDIASKILTSDEPLEKLIARIHQVGSALPLEDDDGGMDSKELWQLVKKETVSSIIPAIDIIAGWLLSIVEAIDPDEIAGYYFNTIHISLGDAPEGFYFMMAHAPCENGILHISTFEESESLLEAADEDYHRANELTGELFERLADEAPSEQGMFFWEAVVALGIKKAASQIDIKKRFPGQDAIYLLTGANECYNYAGTLSDKGWIWENLTVEW